MPRIVAITLSCLFLISHTTVVAIESCDEDMESVAELDKAFDAANFVFVATVIGENKIGSSLKYKLHAPALKGKVPSVGEITQAEACWGIPFLNGEAILLLFVDSLEEKISRKNWVLVALGKNEPGYTWVADWLAQKTSNKALHWPPGYLSRPLHPQRPRQILVAS